MKRPGAKSCNCETSLSPLYATVASRSDSPDTARALVRLRGSFYVDSVDGLRRLYPAETVELSFTTIAGALNEDPRILYFERDTDKTLFLLVYPEFASLL